LTISYANGTLELSIEIKTIKLIFKALVITSDNICYDYYKKVITNVERHWFFSVERNENMFPEIIRKMKEKNETNKDVANVLGLDRSQISRKLRGEVQWTFKDIKLLCKHYNMSFNKLFRKEGE
jgi:antitoxin component HigA of HigAB toxin-antitoxin module